MSSAPANDASVADVWRGALVGETIKVKFWRVPASRIPRDRGERVVWLLRQWQRVDAEVASMLGEDADA